MTSRDGIDFVTHKCAEGHHFYRDLEYKPAMAAAKALGVPVLGAYFVNHSGTVSDQVDWFLQLVNADTPWWRDVPWMWQIDAEKFSYMDRAPNLAEINAFGDLICSRANVPASSVIAYAPKWLYGNTLVGLKYKLWASSYVSGSGSYKTLYPGDGSVRWAPYSGQTPIILQYSSSAVIAGQTTCDANGYRGTLSDLITQIGGEEGGISDMPARFTFQGFADNPPTATPGGISRTHVTDGLRYIIQQYSGTADKLKTTAGFGPTVNLTPTNTGFDTYAVAVKVYCGSPDPGEATVPPIDIQALAAAIVAALPPIEGGLTKEDVTVACLAALTRLSLNVTL